MKKLLLALALTLLPTIAFAQCNGIFPPGTACGNNGASPALPFAVPLGGLTNLAVGGTSITNGTNGYVLYDNNGVLGNYPITGTGNVVLNNNPNFNGFSFQMSGFNMTFPTQNATLTFQSGAWTIGDCLTVASTTGAIADSGSTGCGGGGSLSAITFQTFTGVGGAGSVTLTTTPLPTATNQITAVFFDGVQQSRGNWSFNTGTKVITIAIPPTIQVVEVDWNPPTTFAGVASITTGASTLTGAVTLTAGANVSLTPSGQNITVAATNSITSVSNSDGSLTISPITGAVVASLNPAHNPNFTGGVNIKNDLFADYLRGYADISQWGATKPVCNPGSPTSTNVAAAVVAAYNAGARGFFFPDGCFAWTGDSAWTTAFGTNIIPSNTRWAGANWKTDGFSVCSTYTGCVPTSGEEISVGSFVETRFMFYNSWSCYDLDAQAFGNPLNCPIAIFETTNFPGGNFSGYPFQAFNSYTTTGTWGTWNGTDTPQIGLTNNSTGDSIFIDNGSGNSGAHLFNLFGIGGTVGTWNADGRITAGNSSTSHASGSITVQDNTSNGTYFTGNTTWTVSSDRRLKTEIKPDKSELNWLASFTIHSYRWLKTGAPGVGPIAQELQKKHPELVHIGAADAPCDPNDTARQKGCWTVDTPDIWQMLRAMQEMQREIVALRRARR